MDERARNKFCFWWKGEKSQSFQAIVPLNANVRLDTLVLRPNPSASFDFSGTKDLGRFYPIVYYLP
jgi:phosphoribosyl-AMP cyclohydrolase